MKVLLIAPLPPPATGHSLAARLLLDALHGRHEVAVVDLSKSGFKHGVDSARRLGQVVAILLMVLRKQLGADVIYLTIAESLAGNLKDLLIYVICFPKLSRMVVHLHGGSLRRLLFDRHGIVRALNRWFLQRLGAVVILGESHKDIFAGLVCPERIRIIVNCADDELFVDDETIEAKFADDGPLRVLFLSNLIDGKGHHDLVEAYLGLSERSRHQIEIDFAGAFDSVTERDRFEKQIRGVNQIRNHGVVRGAAKARLLARAHVLCLPTSLFEGQPMAILEAYASGCVVVTTDMGGIRDVFANGSNGFQIEKKSPASIRRALEQASLNRGELKQMALFNATEARRKYRVSRYAESLIQVMEDVRETNLTT